jgi:GNAT superfamily N-acetyltransferase
MDALVRPARTSDKAPLMSFIKDVWGGHDYIPKVWDHWIRDTKNRMFVVVADGVPVGMNRIRFLEDGSAWFEGARVHPRYRGRGLGSMLGENSMKVARGLGINTFRLTSGSRNHTAHRQIARIKFREVARFSIYEQSRLQRREGDAEAVPKGGTWKALQLMKKSAEYRLGGGVFWHDWGAAALKPQVVHRMVGRGDVRVFGDAVAVAWRRGEGGRPWPEVGFVGGPPSEASKLVKSVLSEAKARGGLVFLPQGSPIIHELRESGFRRSFSNILYERKATKG